MASSKPLILTPILAHKNILTDQDFVVWSQGDQVENFVDAIKYAFDNREFLETAAKIAPDFVKNKYDWLCQGKKLADYLNSIF
jgi:tRNA/tmRNA/rRNA uracil-C5-methylase (TrmA/RlmC/RlmD family)